MITNYFKKATTKKSKKRKLEEIDIDNISPESNTNNNNSDNNPPIKKKRKLSTDNDNKEESDNNNDNDKIEKKSKDDSNDKIEKKSEENDDEKENGEKSANDNDNNKIKKKSEENDDDYKTENKEITFSNIHLSLHSSWRNVLSSQFKLGYYKDLCRKLEKERKLGVEIFPPISMVFRAFELCPWSSLKVVIIGQDPYHDDNQAEGLCFSVQKGIKIPSSLRNMYKEASTDVNFVDPKHGSLIDWGKQGILLLNTVLTVQAHKANTHKKFGWIEFTDNVIKAINKRDDKIIFILWGGQAQKKKKIINTKKHKIIESVHPSGLSAYRGFIGSKPYSKCNKLLKELGKEEINWQISF